MLVLGIESSCDETALALVDETGERASVMSSQVDIHALFGGVVPELASREHARLIGPLFDELWRRAFPGGAEEGWAAIDRIAVTRGPGLLGSLLVGLAFAKALALGRNVPLIGVNHLYAHLLAAGIPDAAPLEYPALGILVSGGHTHLYRMNGPTAMIVMGRTLDDAAGEACDKFAKAIGLPYPGGPLLDALGQAGEARPLFPRPYVDNDNLNFSFSGLKTSGALWARRNPQACLGSVEPPPEGAAAAPYYLAAASPQLCDAAASYLLAVADTLVIKARRALALFSPRCLVLAGGVAANSVVRRRLGELAAEFGVPLRVPPPRLCTDNGIMVAWNGLLLAREGLGHDLSVSAVPRGRPVPDDWRRLPA